LTKNQFVKRVYNNKLIRWATLAASAGNLER